MNPIATAGHSKSTTPARRRLGTAILVALQLTAAPLAGAFTIPTTDPDVSAHWDTTFKYSSAWRLKDRSSTLTADANTDDGDRNFAKGLVSNRIDILSEFDLTYKNLGIRISGAGWYDSIYNQRNDNDSPYTVNSNSVPYNEFTHATRDLAGRKAELLDAFVFGSGDVGGHSVSWRLGKHTLLYGETLFFGTNGVAAAQAPMDYIKLLSVPNTQFKELMRPLSQASGQVTLNDATTLGAYYQFDWERDRLPPAGSYFSNVDILDGGAEQILLGASLPAAQRTRDIEPTKSGQGGLSLRYHPDWMPGELGFYFARWHARAPIVYAHLAEVQVIGAPEGTTAFVPSTYQLVFPEGIRTVGVSYTQTVGQANYAVEASFRENMPLVPAGGSVAILPGQLADNSSHPAYPIGNTVHLNLSALVSLPRTGLWPGGFWLTEIAGHYRVATTANASAIDPNSTRGAVALRTSFMPNYYQVLPGLDLTVNVGLGYTPIGRSSILTSFNGGSTHGGDLSLGVSGVYKTVWNGGISYTHYLGSAETVVGPPNASIQAYTFGQSLKDRDFISLTLSRTF